MTNPPIPPAVVDTHGSPELDEDAEKLIALGQDRGPSLADFERALRISPRAGFYWAKWRIADEGTPEETCRGADAVWEVVEVFENHIVDGEPDQFRVSVCGVERSQSFENFYWGPSPIKKLEPPK